jgi:hypothetical protein
VEGEMGEMSVMGVMGVLDGQVGRRKTRAMDE